MSASIRASFDALATREITWVQFISRTDKYWSRIADRWFRMFDSLPAAIELVDVRQEVALASFVAYKRWESNHEGVLRVVVATAVRRAVATWLNSQRSSYKRRCSSPSRVPVRCDDFDRYVSSTPNQERVTNVRKRVNGVMAVARLLPSRVDRVCFELLAASLFDVYAAAEAMVSSTHLKLITRANTTTDATRLINRAIRSYV